MSSVSSVMKMSLIESFIDVRELREPLCIPETTRSMVPEFCFAIDSNIIHVNWSAIEQEGLQYAQAIQSYWPENKVFRKPQHIVLQEETSWPAIFNVLSDLKVPDIVQPDMAAKIHDFALSMANERCNLGGVVLYIAVCIEVKVPAVEIEDIPVPADNSEFVAIATDALKKLMVDESNLSDKHCVICEEGFSVRREATRLPCAHVYHEGCIMKWLMRSIFCPICRYRLD